MFTFSSPWHDLYFVMVEQQNKAALDHSLVIITILWFHCWMFADDICNTGMIYMKYRRVGCFYLQLVT